MQQAKNKKKKQKREQKPVDSYGGGDYISQYSSIMFTFLYIQKEYITCCEATH